MAENHSQNGDGSNRVSELAVRGVDEYKQKRRLERILSDLEKIGDTSREAWMGYVNGSIDQRGRDIAVQRTVKEAIWECRSLLESHAKEKNPERDNYWFGNPGEPVGIIEQAEGTDIVLAGLYDFLYQDEIWCESFTERIKPRNLPVETITREIWHTVPDTVSRDAAARLTKFLAEEHGIELATEQMEIDEHADPF